MHIQIPMYDKSVTNPTGLLVDAMSDAASLPWYEAGGLVGNFEALFALQIGVAH